MPSPGRLEGRTCLIVGGTSGIGLASARRFLQEGARVIVAGREPDIGLSGLREQLAPLGPAWDFCLDLELGEPDVLRLFEFARATFDKILHHADVVSRRAPAQVDLRRTGDRRRQVAWS